MDQRSSEVSEEKPEEYLSSEKNTLDIFRTQLLGQYESLISAKLDSSKKEDSSILSTWNDFYKACSLYYKKLAEAEVRRKYVEVVSGECEKPDSSKNEDSSITGYGFYKGFRSYPLYLGELAEAEVGPKYVEVVSGECDGRPINEYSYISSVDGRTWKIKSRGKVSETLDHSNIGLEGLIQLAIDGINSRGSTSKEISNPIALAPAVTDALGCGGYTPWGSQGKNADPSNPSGGKGMFGGFPSPPGGVNVPETKFDNHQDISIDIPDDPNFKVIPMIPTNIKDGESIDNRNIVNHIISVHHVRLEQERSTDSGLKLAEVVLGITGQAAFSLLGYSLTSSSSPALKFVVGANAVGFIGTLTAILLRRKNRVASGIAGKVGAVAAASGIVVAMGMFLPEKFVWSSGIACLFPAVAVVAFA